VNDHVPLGQTRAQTLSDWKGLADADAARSAVFAALLARGGVTGPEPVFEGRAGFFRLVSGPVDVDVDSFGRRGVPYRIHKVGMKPYPAQVYTQTAIVASNQVVKEAGGTDRIAAVEVATTHRGYEMAGSEAEKWAPATRDTADHSLPYIVARAMFDGDISNDSYTPDKLHDPRILAFMRKITVAEDKAFAKPLGNAPSSRVTAILEDGRRISRQIDNLPGFPGQPMQRADVDRKFRSNAGRRWPQQRVEAILQGLWAIDRTDDLSALLGKLALQASL
jgi:2-methylcitrate dehydratase